MMWSSALEYEKIDLWRSQEKMTDWRTQEMMRSSGLEYEQKTDWRLMRSFELEAD